MKDIIDATTKITTRTSKVFKRTAIVLDDGEDSGSLDLVTEDGKLICRINIFKRPNIEGANIDIIWDLKDEPDTEGQRARLIEFNHGNQVLNYRVAAEMIAIHIYREGDTK